MATIFAYFFKLGGKLGWISDRTKASSGTISKILEETPEGFANSPYEEISTKLLRPIRRQFIRKL